MDLQFTGNKSSVNWALYLLSWIRKR